MDRPADSILAGDGQAYLERFEQFRRTESEQFGMDINPKINTPGRNLFIPKGGLLRATAGDTSGNTGRGRMERYVLKGILWDPSDPAAVVNDTVVGLESHIGSYRVVNITENQVIMRSADNELKLELPEQTNEAF